MQSVSHGMLAAKNNFTYADQDAWLDQGKIFEERNGGSEAEANSSADRVVKLNRLSCRRRQIAWPMRR